MLSIDDFLPVSISDRDLFVRHYAKYPQDHSDNSFTNMVCWNHYAGYRYARIKSSIVLASTVEGETSFRPPIGPRDPDLLREVLRLAAREGAEKPLHIFSNAMKEWIQQQYPALVLYPDRDYADYVYATTDLAQLPGKKYLSIRRQLNKFRKNCDYVIEPISRENFCEVREFLAKWCEWKHCDESPVLAYEKDAVLFAVDHFFELGVSGITVRVDGGITGMAIYDELSRDAAVVHFEKGLPDCEGIYKEVNQATAQQLLDRYRYVNRESDLGISGLREAKMRYHPDHLVEVWYAKKEEIRI
ncbi:MAG: DUF2156 domain-containing protein [Methanomicrobiales archaeon]|nr:DUF2156 domain-containing protein [Methanomicrobiales archaeon]